MIGIRIQLKGEVAFETYLKLEEGYRCDVPTDVLGIPFLPLIEILKRDIPSFSLPEDFEVGFARPEGYIGLLEEAVKLCNLVPNGKKLIRSFYTNEHFHAGSGDKLRSLKSGLVFYAPLLMKGRDLNKVAQTVQAVTRIGVREEEITGEISCSLVEQNEPHGKAENHSGQLTYSRLEYSLGLLAPASLYAPYDDGDKTYSYISGSKLRKALLAWQSDSFLKENLPDMRFSNAYIANKGTRLLPVPLCMSVVKLDKEQLRYRLASGKDPNRVEQDVGLEGAFSARFDEHFMQYVKPLTERITSSDGKPFDALSEGQVFKGMIYGTDEQLRRTAEWLRKNPYINLGVLQNEGYGQAYITVDALKEDSLPMEYMSSCFDVACMSHTLLYNEEGMPGTRAEDLLREIEYVTGLPGAFEIVGRYTNVYMDYANRFGWGGDGPVTRCLKMGSILRIRTKDGSCVDISPIRHTFIGENTGDGYGEIMAWPAANEYYRITKEVLPRTYEMDFVSPASELHLGARMIHGILTALLRSRVKALGAVDSADTTGEEGREIPVPGEVLEMLKDTYDPEIDLVILESWYREALRGSLNRKEELHVRNQS